MAARNLVTSMLCCVLFLGTVLNCDRESDHHSQDEFAFAAMGLEADNITYGLARTYTTPVPEEDPWNFGSALAVLDDGILIANPAIYDALGEVYLYEYDPSSPSCDPPYPIHTFRPPDSEQQCFGRGLATSGGRIIIGASCADIGAVMNAGKAYMIDGDLESPTFGDVLMTFFNPNPASSDNFPDSITFTGQYVLFGVAWSDLHAPGDGVAYLFDADPTSPRFGDLLATFVNPSPQPEYSHFGSATAVVGNLALIGAPQDGTVGTNHGAVHVFDISGDPASPDFGRHVTTIYNPVSQADPTADFGASIVNIGNYVYIGAPYYASADGARVGRVYVYDFSLDPTNPSLLQPPFENPFPDRTLQFGRSLVAAGNDVFIGSRNPQPLTYEYIEDAVFLFDADPSSVNFGSLKASIFDPTPWEYDNKFGYTMATIGDDVFVGVYPNHALAENAVYLYRPEPFARGLCLSVTTDKSKYTKKDTIAQITVQVLVENSEVEGAAVEVVVTNPKGATTTFNGETDSTGVVSFTYELESGRSRKGIYTVDATATRAGYESGSGSTTFRVR